MQHGLGVSAFVLALASGGLLLANSANAIALPPWARTMMGGLLVLSIAIFGLYMFSMSAFGSALRPDPARVAEVRESQFVGQVTLAYGLQDWMRRGGSQAKVQVYAEGLVIELSSFEPFAIRRNELRSMRDERSGLVPDRDRAQLDAGPIADLPPERAWHSGTSERTPGEKVMKRDLRAAVDLAST